MKFKIEEYFSKTYLILFAILAVLLLIKFNGIIIFSSPLLQSIFSLLICLSTFSLFTATFFIKKQILLIISFGVFGMLSFLCLFLGFFSVLGIRNFSTNGDVDSSFECIKQIKLDNSTVKEYMTIYGDADPGTVIRKEKTILPGILYVNKLFDQKSIVAEIKMNNDTLLIADENNQVIKKIILK